MSNSKELFKWQVVVSCTHAVETVGICHSPFPLELTQSIPGCQLPPCEAILNLMLKVSYPLLSTYYGAGALPTILSVISNIHYL